MSAGAGDDGGAGYVVDQPGGNLALDLFVVDQHLGMVLDTANGEFLSVAASAPSAAVVTAVT